MQEQKEIEFHHVITVDNLGGLRRQINILYDTDGVSQALDNAAKAVAKQVQIRGFRKGKAPVALVKNYCQPQIELTAQSILSQKGYFHACNEHGLVVLKEPEFNDLKFNPDGTFTCNIIAEVKPIIEPTGYIGLKLEKNIVDPDPIYKNMMKEIRHGHATDQQINEVKSETMVTVDFRVLLEGNEVNAGANQPFFITDIQEPPFGKNLIGAKVNEKCLATITLPNEYGRNSGKEAQVEITIKSVVEKVKPTDEELVERTESPSFEELESVVKKRAEQQALAQELAALQELAISKLLEFHDFDVPSDWVRDEERHVLSQFGVQKAPDEDTQKLIADMALRNVKRTFLLDAIYENEPQLKITQEDIKKLIEQEAEASGVSTLMVKKEWEEKKVMPEVLAFIKHKKVLDLVLSNAQIETESASNNILDVPENPMESVEV